MEVHPASKSYLPESVGNYGAMYRLQVLELWMTARPLMPVRLPHFRYRCIDNRPFLQMINILNNDVANMK